MSFNLIYFPITLRPPNSDPDWRDDLSGAFPSFICACTAIEGLAGYRYPDDQNGPRFEKFVTEYFPQPYNNRTWAKELWHFRNSLVHAFNPGQHFEITQHHLDRHLQKQPDGRTMLNAEDFRKALHEAAEKYFQELRSNEACQEAFSKRANDPRQGGLPRIGFFH